MPTDAAENLLVDHDSGKFFLVPFVKPSGVAYWVGMNRYEVFPVPNFPIFARRVLQAALSGRPYEVALH